MAHDLSFLGWVKVERLLGIRIVSGCLLTLVIICFVLSITIDSERALCLPGGLSSVRSENLIGCLLGLLLHAPVVAISGCLMLATFRSSKSDMFGPRQMFTVNISTWIRILGIVGLLGTILGPANLNFLTCTFLNPLWYLYLVIYVFCIIAGSGGLRLSLTEDIELEVPIRRRTREEIRIRKKKVRHSRKMSEKRELLEAKSKPARASDKSKRQSKAAPGKSRAPGTSSPSPGKSRAPGKSKPAPRSRAAPKHPELAKAKVVSPNKGSPKRKASIPKKDSPKRSPKERRRSEPKRSPKRKPSDQTAKPQPQKASSPQNDHPLTRFRQSVDKGTPKPKTRTPKSEKAVRFQIKVEEV